VLLRRRQEPVVESDAARRAGRADGDAGGDDPASPEAAGPDDGAGRRPEETQVTATAATTRE
jgi:hypothetical protein